MLKLKEITILLVEDDAGVRQFLQEILSAQGCNLLLAQNGLEALSVSKAAQGAIDLLLTDVILPGLDGHTVAQRLKQTYPDLKVLFISGYGDEIIENHASKDTGAVFLRKPFNIARLNEAIQKALEA